MKAWNSIVHLRNYLRKDYEDHEDFQKFCALISDCKKNDISFDGLYIAVMNCYKFGIKEQENLDLIMLQNITYTVTGEIYNKYLSNSLIHNVTYSGTIRDFLTREDCKEYKDFYGFIAEDFSIELGRSLNMTLLEDGNTDFSAFHNINKNQNIKKFCKMVDANDKLNAFDIFKIYRSIYPTSWGRGSKYYLREMIIYDAVLRFYRYSEEKRKQVRFYDFLLVEIVRHYICINRKHLDVSSIFGHQEALPCPFCGKQPKIYMTTSIFDIDVVVNIECEDCFHFMSQNIVETSGMNQPPKLYIHSFEEAIDILIAKWDSRIVNDDMWLDDETLPDELPECEPDMPSKIVYAPGLKPCPFCGSKAGFRKRNSAKKRDGKRDPEGIKTIKVVCSKGCFSASHFGTPERIPDKGTIGYMAYRWNQRKILA